MFDASEYSLPSPVSEIPFTFTTIVEVSINELSRINLWSIDPLTTKTFLRNVPWKIFISSNDAVPELMVVVISSGIEKT